MDMRKNLVEDLDRIYKKYQELRAILDNSTDQELEDILDGHFNEYATNVDCNFCFMEMILTKKDDDGSKLTNEELEEYFRDSWESLVNP